MLDAPGAADSFRTVRVGSLVRGMRARTVVRVDVDHGHCRRGGMVDAPPRRCTAAAAIAVGSAPLACLAAGLMLLAGGAMAKNSSVEITTTTRPATDQSLRVEITENLVTLSARGATLLDIAKEIAAQGGLIVSLHDSLNEPVTLEFRKLSLPQAIRRIFRHHNFTLHRSNAVAGGKQLQPPKLWV